MRFRPLITVALAAALAGAGPAVTAAAAPAGAEDCVASHYAGAGRELVDVPAKYIPAPLRAFPADCASHIVGDAFGDDAGISVAYTLIYTDASLAELVDIARSFERAGYGDPDGLITSIDDDPNGSVNTTVSLHADEVAALDPQDLGFAHGRFSNPGGFDVYSIYYTDGDEYKVDQELDTPSIEIELLLSGPFAGTEVDDPSVFSALRVFTPPTPVQTGVIAGGAVALMLVVGWPANLLNSVVGTRYDGLVRWLQGRFGRRKKKDVEAEAPKTGSRLPGWLMWPGFAIAALIGAFVDPDFGWNAMSIRVVATLFVSFVLFNLATWAIVRVIARRVQPDSEPLLRFRWGSLFLVALAVVIARLLQLEPGIVFGLVAGVAYATALRARGSAILALVGSGFGLVLALVAWVAYSFLVPAAAATPDSIPLIVGTEFLAAVTVKGVSSLPLALLPLGTLDGAKIAKWRKLVWGVAYAIGLAAFMLVLITIPKAWGEIPGDFVRWVVVFGLYALVAVVIWIVNARMINRRPPKESPIGEQPDAITID